MANDTREKIILAAMDQFSEKGYSATNIQSIADSVGIVKSALYRHYESKEEIWNAVFEMMILYYEDHFTHAADLQNIPQTTDELIEMTMRMVNFTVYDEKVSKMRKILLTEQFRDHRLSGLATRFFIHDIKATFEKVFSGMIASGVIRKIDVSFLAFSYTSPISALIHLCDREPERVKETMDEIESFVKKFVEIYAS